jgi:hypothetical protein
VKPGESAQLSPAACAWRDVVSELRRRRDAGESIREIARATGLSKSQVGRELRDYRPAAEGLSRSLGLSPVPELRDVPGPGDSPEGTAAARPREGTPLFRDGRIILDLCGGSGSWSEPYREAGYDVRVVTLPGGDVRTYVPPSGVWGVLCAPPCTVFSVANGHVHPDDRDWLRGMECVNACMRVVLQSNPRWWALENPAPGYLSRFLGPPLYTFQHRDFGHPGYKNTGLWGSFRFPQKQAQRHPEPAPAIEYIHGRDRAARRAVTPPGFARAFFEANQ